MNITVIIPIHEFNEKNGEYILKALESVDKQEDGNIPNKLIMTSAVCNADVVDFLNKNYKNNYVVIINNTDSSYQGQVNNAMQYITTDYFSVLEFDDEYSTTYFKNTEKYIKSYPNVDIFMSMIIEVNDKNEGIKLTNETAWAQQFVGENGEIGYLNLKSLKEYTDFKLSGAVIKKSEFINIGKYKTNMKLTFMYEFLLRALNNACKVFVIPKIGYKHLSTREGSLFDMYLKELSMNERKFWFETAVSESNFINDRIIDMSRLKKQIIT